MRKLTFLLALQAFIAATPAYAYIGPGAGAGTIAVVFGVISAVFLALFAILWYPFKRLIKRFRGSRADVADGSETTAGER
jgi:uncharacterized membrane protein